MEILSLGLLKKARRDKGMSTIDAAAVIGKEKSAINRLETGVCDIRVSTLSKLLDAYRVSVTDVFVKKKVIVCTGLTSEG